MATREEIIEESLKRLLKKPDDQDAVTLLYKSVEPLTGFALNSRRVKNVDDPQTTVTASVVTEILNRLRRTKRADLGYDRALAFVMIKIKGRCSDHLKRQRKKELRTNVSDAIWNCIASPLPKQHPAEEIAAMQMDFPDEPNWALLQRWADGFTFVEIGKEFGLTPDAARKRHKRFLNKVREFFAEKRDGK